jgi:hypothetical protein
MTDEPGTAETWIREDESWLLDAKALCAQIGAVYITRFDGDLYAGIPGRGEVPLADLMAEIGKRGSLTAIK